MYNEDDKSSDASFSKITSGYTWSPLITYQLKPTMLRKRRGNKLTQVKFEEVIIDGTFVSE